MGFIHLPSEEELRMSTSYHKIFALTLFWNVGLLGILIVFLFIIFFILKAYQLKINKNPLNNIRQSLLSEQARQQSRRVSEQQAEMLEKQNSDLSPLLQNTVQNPTTKRFKVCNFFTSFFFYFFWADIALVYLVFYIFGYMGRGVSHDILTVFIMTLIVVVPTIIWKNGTKVKKIKFIKNQVIFTGICLLLWLGLSIFLVITLKGACLCYYNDNYGISVGTQNGPFLSTQWTRTNAIQKICKQNQVCNIYATVPQNTDTQVFINMHTGVQITNLTIRLQGEGKNQTRQIKTVIPMANVQEIGKRNVHSILFKNLAPNTTYSIEVYITPQSGQKLGQPIKKTNYRTLPSKDTSILKMAIGGDVSMTHEGNMITSNLVDYDPDIIIIGGDNTYDDGMRTCYYSWDNFYKIFDNLNNHPKINRLIPLIMSIGNHDVGFDALATTQISRDQLQIPLYFMFNPQHSALDDKTDGIPTLDDRSTVHHHIIGPTVHLNLDSGYVIPFENQISKIQSIGQKYKNYYLFANYHNPIYPSCTDFNENSNDRNVIANATRYWTPKFDSYSFVAGFEHHTHHKKFTKKIKNGAISTDGTGVRYVGDGSWGVQETSCPAHKVSPSQKFQFYDTKQPNHIWLVTLKSDNKKDYTINYTAIDIYGKTNYTMSQSLKPLNEAVQLN